MRNTVAEQSERVLEETGEGGFQTMCQIMLGREGKRERETGREMCMCGGKVFNIN